MFSRAKSCPSREIRATTAPNTCESVQIDRKENRERTRVRSLHPRNSALNRSCFQKLTRTGLIDRASVAQESNMFKEQIESEEFFSLLEKLMGTPTAPFREHQVRELVVSEVSRWSHVSLKEDEWGNLLISYRHASAEENWIFCAHMDHPAFVDGEFLGSIRPEYLCSQNQTARYANGISMWDLPGFERRDGWIRGRACDDLVGCAVALATVFHHARNQTRCRVHALLTVAEEVGLYGAALACTGGLIPEKATLISLETSPALSESQFHSGCIVRVGDKRSIFSPSATRALIDAAIKRKIVYQRRLMDGGSCEGSIFYEAGHHTGAICVALGNPHNQGVDGKTAMEYVSESDVIEMLKLAIAASEITSVIPDRNIGSVEKIASRAAQELSVRGGRKNNPI